jgi:DNA-binding MarR family transcriptional regulator
MTEIHLTERGISGLWSIAGGRMMPLLQKQKKKDGIAGIRVMSRAYSLMNSLIKDIFNDILDLEEKSLRYCNVKDLSITEMHVLEVIGDADGRTMSEAAMALGITVGSLTTAVNKLVKKNYVLRKRDESDRRIVMIQLSRKGKTVYRLHEKFHMNMVQNMIKGLSSDEERILVKVLENLNGFFTNLGKKHKEVRE